VETSISWNYTTWLNLAFLALTAVLVARFIRTSGIPMLKMMGGSPNATEQHDHGGHGQGNHDHHDRPGPARPADTEQQHEHDHRPHERGTHEHGPHED